MSKLGIGLIGAGFMGRSHAIAYSTLPTVFSLGLEIECEILADFDSKLASRRAAELGFRRSTGDWMELVNDPNVDIVDICTPNYLHKEMALAAISAGKHVYCEKPLTLSAADSLMLTEAAENANVKTIVGFNYAKNPAATLAREIIEAGEIGEIIGFRGVHNEDYLSDPQIPHSWRLQRKYAGLGVMADHCHIINMAQYLVGEFSELCATLRTVIPERSDSKSGKMCPVENEDEGYLLCHFKNGAIGTIGCSRVAAGRKMALCYEVEGSKGSLSFNQEHMNQLQLYDAGDVPGRRGFRTILMGPEHTDYSAFCPAPGHGLGYNDQKVIEARDLVLGIRDDSPVLPDFRAAYQTDRVLEAVLISHSERRWVQMTEIS